MDLGPLLQTNDTKILFVIADGLGGLDVDGRGTELEAARTPHLDSLAREGTTGLMVPVAPGITPGSGPGHLGLFGFDPLEHNIGRGVLAALGINFDLQSGDVAARGNFCTVDDHAVVTDRRAGRISSDRGAELVRKLAQISIEGAEIFVEPVKEHRFLLVIRAEQLGADIADTDPQKTGVEPLPARARDEKSERTAQIVGEFIAKAREILASEHPANMVLLRGFAKRPSLPTMQERYGLRSCALAGYPMYRGIARLLGMDVIECGPDLESEVDALHKRWGDHDYFFLHYKPTDSRGEDGAFDAKVQAIEELDRMMPKILKNQPDVVVVTGDHSTPSLLKSHSWHPVPVLLSARTCRRDAVETFGETACIRGGLSQFLAKELMTLALAHANRLRKFGA